MIFLHIFVAIILFIVGIFLITDGGSFIAGKFTGNIYQLEYPANIIVAISIFILSLFFILILKKDKKYRKYSEWLLIGALIIFTVGFFI